VVDQIEELLTRASRPPTSSAFGGSCTRSPTAPLQIVATIRSEFLDDLLA
jgi:hypothetical protein